MNRLLFFMIVCLVPVVVFAGDDVIEGGFGLKFGETVDVENMEKIQNEKEGGVRYAYTPEHPYGPLTQYELVVTPKSNRVYKIEAMENFSSMSDCRRELLRLEKVLSKKYKRTGAKVSTRFGDIPKITFGKSSKNIVALCKGVFNSRQLVLTYLDEDLLSEVKMEDSDGEKANEVPTSTHDTSGL